MCMRRMRYAAHGYFGEPIANDSKIWGEFPKEILINCLWAAFTLADFSPYEINDCASKALPKKKQ